MKNCTIDISTKDGRVRHFEGESIYTAYTGDRCLVLDENKDRDQILESLPRNDILEMTVHITGVDAWGNPN